MELISNLKQADGSSVGEFMREDVSSSCISRHGDILRLDDRPFYCDELHRSGLLAWLKELKGVTVDLPTMPPLYIIHHRGMNLLDVLWVRGLIYQFYWKFYFWIR